MAADFFSNLLGLRPLFIDWSKNGENTCEYRKRKEIALAIVEAANVNKLDLCKLHQDIAINGKLGDWPVEHALPVVEAFRAAGISPGNVSEDKSDFNIIHPRVMHSFERYSRELGGIGTPLFPYQGQNVNPRLVLAYASWPSFTAAMIEKRLQVFSLEYGEKQWTKQQVGELIKAYLTKGGNPNLILFNFPILYLAAENGDVEGATALYKAGADINLAHKGFPSTKQLLTERTLGVKASSWEISLMRSAMNLNGSL